MNELIEIALDGVDNLTKELQALKDAKRLSFDSHHALINDLTRIKNSLQLIQMLESKRNENTTNPVSIDEVIFNK